MLLEKYDQRGKAHRYFTDSRQRPWCNTLILSRTYGYSDLRMCADTFIVPSLSMNTPLFFFIFSKFALILYKAEWSDGKNIGLCQSSKFCFNF